MVWIGMDLRDHLLPMHLKADQAGQSLIPSGLEHLQGQGIQNFSWQCFNSFLVKKFFLIANLNHPYSNLKPLTLFLLLLIQLKYLCPSYNPPLVTGRLLWGLSRAFSSPGWGATGLSACLHRRGFPAHCDDFHGLPWTHSNRSTS